MKVKINVNNDEISLMNVDMVNNMRKYYSKFWAWRLLYVEFSVDLIRAHVVGVSVRSGPGHRLPVHLRLLCHLLGRLEDQWGFRLFGVGRG